VQHRQAQVGNLVQSQSTLEWLPIQSLKIEKHGQGLLKKTRSALWLHNENDTLVLRPFFPKMFFAALVLCFQQWILTTPLFSPPFSEQTSSFLHVLYGTSGLECKQS
jgi:hypothetical protein